MSEFNRYIMEVFSLRNFTELRMIFSVIILVVIWVTKFVAIKIIEKKVEDRKHIYKLKKISSIVIYSIGMFALGRVWIEDFTQLIAFLSAGLAIALKEPIENIFGWLFIMSRKPFELGDRIQLGEHSGDVIDIRAFEFTIMEIGNWVDADQSTGRMIHIPNGKVFTESLANYNRGFKYIWNEIEVIITFESDWQKAKKLLQDISHKRAEKLTKEAQKNLYEVSKKYMIYYSKLTPIVYTTAKDIGIALTVRYLCRPQRRRTTQALIWEDILLEFKEHEDIDFAYPTQRIIKS